jgi:hypothetical protein
MSPPLAVVSVPPTIVPSTFTVEPVPVAVMGAAGVGDRVEKLEHSAAGRFERSGVGDAACLR